MWRRGIYGGVGRKLRQKRDVRMTVGNRTAGRNKDRCRYGSLILALKGLLLATLQQRFHVTTPKCTTGHQKGEQTGNSD